jgi:gamma-glutamyltranspeptidase / glutathione hydrolase
MRDFQKPGRSAVYALNGMCATSHPLAAQVAVGLMQAGGTAVDAAIGAALVLGICEPQMTGIGGDCFVLVRPGGGDEVLALNGSGRAPRGLSAADLRAKGQTRVPTYGIEAVTVPGAIDAFCRLHDRLGKLELAQVLAPAIRYAEEGVPVAPRVALDWGKAAHLQGAGLTHYRPWGRAPQVGETFRAPGQAEVLRRIAAGGRDAFYTGEVAQDMVDSLRALGGTHTLEDFAATEASWNDPITARYHGAEVIEHAPNGQGATALLMLSMLERFGLAAMEPMGAARLHLEAEATRLAYDARDRFIADPDLPGAEARLARMLAPATAARLAALIDPDRALGPVAPLTDEVHRDTVYLCVVDRDGTAVSLIYSIYHSFGAGLASDRFGIGFQNRGAGFTLTEGHPNELTGGQRPMHTIIPGMARLPGGVLMPFGVMGGSYQPAGHARLISNLVDYGMDLQEAVDAPRAFNGPEGFALETGYAPDVLEALAEKGHAPVWSDAPMGGAQAIAIDPSGLLVGASDPRKDGCALGY